jgi:hypothetical protein
MHDLDEFGEDIGESLQELLEASRAAGAEQTEPAGAAR